MALLKSILKLVIHRGAFYNPTSITTRKLIFEVETLKTGLAVTDCS